MPIVESRIRTGYSKRRLLARRDSRSTSRSRRPDRSRPGSSGSGRSRRRRSCRRRSLAARQRQAMIRRAGDRAAVSATEADRSARRVRSGGSAPTISKRHGADRQHELGQRRRTNGMIGRSRDRSAQFARAVDVRCAPTACLIVLDQRGHRGRRHVEHRLRIDAEQDRQDRPAARRSRFRASSRSRMCAKRRLFELAEDHLAVEPQRVAGRQDDAERRERRAPRC